jgi:hypothetical protein
MIRYIVFILFSFLHVQIVLSEENIVNRKCDLVFNGYAYHYYTNSKIQSYTSMYIYTLKDGTARYNPVMKYSCKDIEANVTSMIWKGKTLSSYSSGGTDGTVELIVMHVDGCDDTSCELFTDLPGTYASTSASIKNSQVAESIVGWAKQTEKTVEMTENAWGMDITDDFEISISLRTSSYLYTWLTNPSLNVEFSIPSSCYIDTFARSYYKYSGSLLLQGESSTVECLENYELVDPSDATVTCTEHDTFDKPNLCQIMTCPTPATPFNSESVEILDDMEQPTTRFHHLGYYKYRCKQGYRSTVTNPTNNLDSRTGVIQCISGNLYQNGTNPEISPRRWTGAKDTTVTPYCASISKTKVSIVPLALRRYARFVSSTFQCEPSSSYYFNYFYYLYSYNIGIFSIDTTNLRDTLLSIYGTKKINMRYQFINRRTSGSLKINQASIFLLKEYNNEEVCSVSNKESCIDTTSPPIDSDNNPNNIRKALSFDISTEKLCMHTKSDYNSNNGKVIRSIMSSQLDAPFPSTINVTYDTYDETSLERASIAENPVDSVALYHCIKNYNCDQLHFAEYWRDSYYDSVGGPGYNSYPTWGYHAFCNPMKDTDCKLSISYYNGLHNTFLKLRNRGKYGSAYKYATSDDIQYKTEHTPSMDTDDYESVNSITGFGTAAALAVYSDELCHNAWTINVTAGGADSSWCRENLLIGRTCVPECPIGKKSNNLITCTDPKTFSVTVPEGMECVVDTCPDSPQPGSIPYGKINDCIALQKDTTCNPLCNDGYIPSGSITCPGGTTENNFKCTLPCGSTVSEEFNHGSNKVPLLNLYGDTLDSDASVTTSNENECKFIQPGETCKPTCDDGFILVGEMKCSIFADFTNTAVCKRICNIDKLIPHARNNDCQTKLLKPGDHCIVRTDGGYSFPGNTKTANITCDSNGDIVYPEDPIKDCDWDPVAKGSVSHCLPSIKDTILNVQGQCKPGQIVKDEETCVHLFKLIDKHDLKSNWSFAVGTEQLRDKGTYTLSTSDASFPTYQYYHDSAPLGCGVAKSSGSYSFGFKGRSYRGINTFAKSYYPYYNYGYKTIPTTDTSNRKFNEYVEGAYETCRDDIAYLKSEHDIDFPGGFYKTNDIWEKYEFLKTFIHWFLSSDDVPVGTTLETRRYATQAWYNVKKPVWDQNDLDMIRAREYAYPLTGGHYWSTTDGPNFNYYLYNIFTYGLVSPRYYGKSNNEGHGIGLADGEFNNIMSIMGQSGGANNYYRKEDGLYKYPAICNAPLRKNWGETCTPICEPGYELIGDAQTCSADGTMSSVPECKPIACQHQPSNTNWKDTFENGNVSHCDPIARVFNKDQPIGCTPICDSGYELVGTFGCESESSELQNNLRCEVKCPGLKDAISNFNDGGSLSHCDDMNHEGKCQATCTNEGEVPVGDVYCLPRYGCSDTCASAKDGVCDDGGSGAEYATCDLGTDCTDCGSRSTTVVNNARCEKELTINVAPNNGVLDSGCNGVKITESTTCEPTCPASAPTLDNPFSVEIDENGDAVLVVAECSGPCAITNGMLRQYNQSGDCSVGLLNEGESCTPVCKYGYIPSGRIHCVNYNTPTDNDFKCTPGPCSTQPSTIPDESLSDSVYVEVDSSVEVPCKLGFTSVGMFTCKDNVLEGSVDCIKQCKYFSKNDGEESFILDKGTSSIMKCVEGYTSTGILEC